MLRKPVRFSELRHRPVDVDCLVPGHELQKAQDFPERFARLVPGQNHVRHRYGAGVDEWIARHAAFALQLHDGVEWIAGRLAPDAAPQTVANHAQRQS